MGFVSNMVNYKILSHNSYTYQRLIFPGGSLEPIFSIYLLEKGEMVRIWGSCIRTNAYGEERILKSNIEYNSSMIQHHIFEDAFNHHF